MSRPGLVVLALALLAPPLHAQLERHATFSLGGGNTRLTAVTGAGTARLSGVTIGGSGRIGGGLLSVEGGYRQGSLAPDSGAGTTQDLAEARLMLAVRPVSWLSVLAGPHALAFITPSGTERWLLFEARARAAGTVVSPAVSTYVELWAALGGSVNVGTGSPSARGGEVGITLLFPRSPVWARLAYGMERATQSGSANIRTVEDIRVSIGIWTGQ
jgi:hypothetical protein